MSEIIKIENIDGDLLVSSREIATNFEKRHNDVVKTIENLTTENFAVKNMFIESTFEHRGNFYKEYLMTRDGFSLLVMGFNGSKSLQWKLKYIEAFNKMEKELKSIFNPYENLSSELKAIMLHDKKIQEVQKEVVTVREDLIDFKDNAPLFNIECDELMKAVKKSATKALGGYKTKAYNNKSLRAKIYSDIQQQIRRQFGVDSYKAIKRCQLHKAIEIVDSYQAPFVLADEVDLVNSQLQLA